MLVLPALALLAGLSVSPARAGWFWEDGSFWGGHSDPQPPPSSRWMRQGDRVWVRRPSWRDSDVEYDFDGSQWRDRRSFDPYALPESATPRRPSRRKTTTASTGADDPRSHVVVPAPPPAPGWRPGVLNVAPGAVKTPGPAATAAAAAVPAGPGSVMPPAATAPAPAATVPSSTMPSATMPGAADAGRLAEAKSLEARQLPVRRPNLEGLDFAPAPAAVPDPAPVVREEDPR